MNARRLINGKQQYVNFFGFCKRVSFKNSMCNIDIVALIAAHDENPIVEMVKPEDILFNLKDSDRLNDYLAIF